MHERVGILFDRLRWEEKELAHRLEDRGVSAELIDAKTLTLALRPSADNELPKIVFERCVSFYRGSNLATILEARGSNVINSSQVLEVCGNKLRTSQLLIKNEIPSPKTILAFSAESALEAIEELGYPCVMKPIVGSWGRQVVRISDKETAEAFIEMKEQQADSMSSIYYVQEMVRRPARDIRCITAGRNVIASVYRYAPENSWKTNVALGGRSEPCPLNDELEQILIKTVELIGPDSILGIDLMESEEFGYVVHEVNGTVEFRGAQTCTKESIAGKMADFLLKDIVVESGMSS